MRSFTIPSSVNNEEFRRIAAKFLGYPTENIKFYVDGGGIFLYPVEDIEVNFRKDMIFQFDVLHEGHEGQG